MKTGIGLGLLLLLATLPALAQTAPTPVPSPTAPATSESSASPGSSATPAGADFDFTPPEGWKKLDYSMTMGGATIVGFWAGEKIPSGGNVSINIGRQATLLDLSDYAAFNVRMLQKAFGPTSGSDAHAEKVCNGTQDGWFLSTPKMTIGAYDFVIEQTLVLGKGSAYVATYTRLSGMPEDPAARKALDTLCSVLTSGA